LKQLTGLDATFLFLERPNSTGHVGGICMLDPSELSAPLNLAALTDLVNERLPLIPLLRQKLRTVPLGLDQPHWIDDDSFDIEYHLREISLPTPGSDAQLAEQISRIHARPLDRSRPLWEIYLVSGLSDGRQAMYTKIHHAAIDGVSGTELMSLLLDLSPEGREVAPTEPFTPEPAPGTATLVGWAARSLAMRPISVLRIVAEAARAAPLLGELVSPLLNRGRGHGDGEVIATRVGLPPRTPFNRPITPHRRYAFRSVNLEQVKQIKNAHGVSVNDVVMAMCAGALRRWLIDHDALPEAPLIAMVPVSVRDEASASALGNKVSAMLAVVPTNLAPPRAFGHLTRRHRHRQAPTCRDPPGPPGRGHRISAPGSRRTGRSRRLLNGTSTPNLAVQFGDLERSRAQYPGVSQGRQNDRLLPGVRRHRRPGAEHHCSGLLG